MGISAKELGLFSLICFLLISLAANAYLFEINEEKAQENGRLSEELTNIASMNQGLMLRIEAMIEEQKAGQDVADSIALSRTERSKKTIQTITVIKDVLKHEDCAAKPIPDADMRVYYN